MKLLKEMNKKELLDEIIRLGQELEDKMNGNKPSEPANARAVEAIFLYGKEDIENLQYENDELEYALQFIER